MVQAKPKSRGKTARTFLGRIRCGYLPWLTQSFRNLHPDAVFSALSAMREVRISRKRLPRPQRQGAMCEILEQRIYMSSLPAPFANVNIGSSAMTDSAIYVGAHAGAAATSLGTVEANGNGHHHHHHHGGGSGGGDPLLTGVNTWDNQTVGANYTLVAGATLNIEDNLTFTSGYTITADAGSVINFIDGTSNTQTVSGTGNIVLNAASGSYAAGQLNVNGANSGSHVTFDNGVNITGPGPISAAANNTIVFADTVTNATLSTAAGGALQSDGSYSTPTIIDSVTLAGNLTLQPYSYLTIEDGLTLSNNAAIYADQSATLTFATGTSQSVGGTGSIVLYTSTGSYGPGSISAVSGNAVTFGSGITIAGGGYIGGGGTFSSYGTINLTGGNLTIGNGGGSFTNFGNINIAGGTLSVGGGSLGPPGPGGSAGYFTNASGGTISVTGGTASLGGYGTVVVSNAGTITVNGGALTAGGYASAGGGYVPGFTNTGAINLESGTITLAGSQSYFAPTVSTWTNSGTMNLSGGTVTLGGVVNYTDLGITGWSYSGGTVDLTGKLTDTGHALTLAPTTTGSWILDGGTIIGGGIAAQTGASMTLPQSTTGTLEGVTLDSNFTLGQSATLYIQNGLTVNATLNDNQSSTLYFENGSTTGQTLGGTGIVQLWNATTNTSGTLGDYDSSGTLTIANGITIEGAGTVQGNSNDTLVNAGTIDANANGQMLTVGNSGGLVWSNTGTLEDGGGILNIEGTFSPSTGGFSYSAGQVEITGTVNNTGDTLALSPTTTGAILLLNGGIVSGGTIAATGGAQLEIGDLSGGTIYGGSGTLEGVTLATNVQLDTSNGGSTLEVEDGLTLRSATIQGGNGSTLYFQNGSTAGQTLDGTGMVQLWNAANSTSGNLFDYDTSGTLTIGSGITIEGAGTIQGSSNNTLANAGTIDANVSGQVLNVGNSGGLVWSSTGTLEDGGGILNIDGTFNPSASNLSYAGGQVEITGTVSNAGNTLTLSPATTGAILLLNGGIISGGTVAATGGVQLEIGSLSGTTIYGGSGTLDGVTLDTGLNIDNGSTLYIKDGLALNGVTVTVDGYSSLQFQNGSTTGQTLGGAGAVELGGTVNGSFTNGYFYDYDSSGALTIGSGITIAGAGYIQGNSNDTLANAGIIEATTAGQTLYLGNNGGLNWSNTGTLEDNGGVLNLNGSFSTGTLGTLAYYSGQMEIGGTLNNTGKTLTLSDATTGTTLLLDGGTITGGTIAASGSAAFTVGNYSNGTIGSASGTLDGVTLDTGSNIDNNSTLYIKDGLTLNGVTVTVDDYSSMQFENGSTTGQTLGGTGTIELGGTVNGSFTNGYFYDYDSSGTLSVANGITIQGAGNIQGNSNDTLANAGIITANISGQILYMGNNGGLNWSNTGTIEDNGGVLNLGGTFTTAQLGSLSYSSGQLEISGTLNNAGTTFTLAPTITGLTPLLDNGTITGGAIAASGGAELVVGNWSGGNVNGGNGTLDGVTMAANIVLDPNNSGSTLIIQDGLILQNVTVFNGNGSTLYFETGSTAGQTLGGTGIVQLWNSTNSTSGNLDAYDYSGPLTIGNGITLEGAGYIQGTGSNTIDNAGTIDANVSGQTLYIQNATLQNTGTLENTNGGSLNVDAPTTTLESGGTVAVGGAGVLTLGQSGGTLVNSGAVNLNGGTLNIQGNTTTANLGLPNWTNSGGAVELSGTLTNAGSTLDISPGNIGAVLQMQTGAAIIGGTVNEAVGSKISVGASQTATLDGVDVTGAGNIDTTQSYAHLTIKDGLTFTGAMTVGDTSTMELANTETISGPAITGRQNLAGISAETPISSYPSATIKLDAGVTATLGSGTYVSGGFYAGTQSGSAATLVNDGTISASGGYSMALNGSYELGGTTGLSVSNYGTIASSGTSSVMLPSDASGNPQATIGEGLAISPTEINLGWYGVPASGTNTILESTDGVHYTTMSNTLPSNNYQILEGLQPNTKYYFKVQSTNASGGTMTYNTGAVSTLPVADSSVPGGASTSDRSGWYLVNNVTQAGTGTPVAASQYDSQPIYAGSAQGALTIALGKLLSTHVNPYMGRAERVSASDGSYCAGYVSIHCPYPGEEIFVDQYCANVTPVPPCGADGGGSGPTGTGPANNLISGGATGPSAPDASYAPVTYFNGAVNYTASDLTANGFDQTLGQTRSWTQQTGDISNPVNGNGWSVAQRPAVISYGGGSVIGVNYDSTGDEIVFTQNAQGQYVSTYQAQGTLTFNGYQYTYTDSSGDQYLFNGFTSYTPAAQQGQIQQYTDAAGNITTYTYDTNSADATYGQLMQVTQADSAGTKEFFNYTYTPVNTVNGQSVEMISSIVQQEQLAGQVNPSTVRQVVYSYYDGSYSGDNTYGNAGDLKTATVEDASGNVINEYYYRYYTPNDLTNSSGASIGYVGGLQYVFNPSNFTSAQESLAAYNAANGTSYDVFNAPATAIVSNANNYFQYDSDRRVTLETTAGVGASSAQGQGTITYSYSTNPNTIDPTNNNQWFFKTVQTNPDGTQQVVYANAQGQTLLSMVVDNTDVGNPANNGKVWITAYQYSNTSGSQGRMIETISPSAINLSASILNGATTASAIQAAIESYADLGLSEGLVQANTGLIDSTTFYTSTTATTTASGGVAGYVEADYVQQGNGGTPIEQDSYTYIQHLDSNGNTIFPEATVTQYQSSANNGSTPETTTYTYSWQNNSYNQVTNQIADLTTTNPVVSTSQNGSGTATTTQTVYNQYGQPVWTMDEKGYITYTAYDNATGAVIQSVQDVNTANLSDLANYSGTYPGGTLTFGSNGYNQYGVPELPTGWATPTGGGLNLVTTSYVDNLGRTIEQISPGGSITLFVYDDAGHAMFTLTGVILNTSNHTLTTTGPITMTRTRIAYNYDFANVNYSGTYTETMTFSVNTPISYTGGTGGQPVVPVLPGFIQGTGTPVGSAANTQPNNVLNLIGDGMSSAPQFSIQTLSRTLYDSGGQQVETDSYQSVNNTIYLATAPGQGYSGSLISNPTSPDQTGNYFASYMAYDVDGKMYKVVDNNGTITDTVYDSLGRVVSDWVGTNDTTSNGQPFTGSNAGTGNNMTEVQSYVYDNNSVGDSNVTEVVQYPDGTANTGTQSVSLLNYDFRDRLVATETGLTLNSSGSPVASSSDPYPLITVSSLDNLGDVTATLTFNGAVTTIANAIVAAGSASPGATLAGLVGYRTSEYDSQNRDYEDQTYSVDPTTGTISTTALTTYTFYGPRGNVIETVAPTGQVTKDVYNGVGELVDVYITDGGAVNNGGSTVLTYAAAESVSNDVVVSQTAYGYGGDGNLIETVHAQRFNTDPILGSSAEGALFTDTVNADGSLTVTPASNADLGARIYYSATYYDAADRAIATVNAGTNPTGTNGTAAPWTRPANAPVSVNDSNFTGDLITLTSYNAAGQVYETTDPRGIVATNFYNSLGETVETIAAYDPTVNGGNPTSDQNQTTLYTYDGIGDQTSMTAEDPSTGNQTTDYVYGVSAATGSGITSNDLLYQTVYPSNGQNDTVSQEYNALGQVIQATDRNGNVHQYTYDTAGREISDTVTTLGVGVDGSVRRIDTTYNAQGLAYLLTSYADTAGTTIVNQVENIYNGLGQLAFQYQALTGAVDVATTPMVQYTYSSPSNGSRITSMVYPNGRTIDYNYSGTNPNSALDNAIGRLDAIVDGANSGEAGHVLEQYSYLGLSTIVARNHPQTNINLTYLGSSGNIGSGGDQYVGLDQFGRIVDQNWVNTSTGQSVNNFTYSYDSNSNVTAENNLLNTAYSQTFTYDPLNRLASNTLGGAAYQSWTLDSQGNWSSHTIYGTTQSQTANAQNQITSISGSTAPTYDGNGNAVSMELTIQGAGGDATLVYDAWNRLVAVKNSSGQITAQYTYNAMGYRVTESYPLGGPGIAAGTTNYLYYDSQWQAIETRTNGTANNNVTSQMVWSAAYINAAILQDPWGGGNIALEGQTYFLQDANWNTVAVIMPNLGPGPAWFVGQRYVYSPYGNATILNADWSEAPSGETPAVDNLYQGMTLDSVTGLYYARSRNYSPSLGRWINQDPAGYINGANTYQFVMSNPVGNLDPLGLWNWWNLFSWPIWHSAPAKVAVDTAKHVPPGGEFCEALATLYGISKGMIARDAHQRLSYDLYNPDSPYFGNPVNDPLYNGLSLWAGGDTANLTPQEHQAIQSWINSHYGPPNK